jgi:hypothetical protein
MESSVTRINRFLALAVLMIVTFIIIACTPSNPDWSLPVAPSSSDIDTSEIESSDNTETLNSSQPNESEWDLTVQERIELAFPPTGPNSPYLDRVLDGGYLEWPEMKYLGEPGYIKLHGTTITPVETFIYESGSVVQYYNPQEGYPIDAPTGLPRSRQGFSMPAVMVPPYTSLVLVHLNAAFDKPCAETPAGKTLFFGYFRISYPTIGASRIEILDPVYYTDLGDFQSVQDYCTENGWAYFLIPGVPLDPTKIWLEYMERTEIEARAIWSLSERPR